MISKPIQRLEYLCSIIPNLLMEMSEEEFSFKKNPAKWSKKEILGHLIDSATNNHHRFVRVQFEDVPVIFYEQDKWNAASRYHEMDSRHLIAFWAIYNHHLAELMKRIPAESLKRECNTGDDQNVTLQWVIEDYVVHLEHHLKQLTTYS